MSDYKPVLENFTGREDLVFVIDRFNFVEYKITEIIALYIDASGEKKNFVNSILLNNAIVSFGSKLKLLFHINATENLFDLNKDDFHRFAQIRNQFAHTGVEVTTIYVDVPGSSKRTLLLESVSSNGKLLSVDAEEALHEFTQIFSRLKPSMNLAAEKMAKKLSQRDAGGGVPA